MTREEAKEILTHNWTRVDNPNYSELELDEAFFMAIEALQTDAVHIHNDGTLEVKVPNAQKVGRVLVMDTDSHIGGGLFYQDDAVQGEWKPIKETLPTYDGGEKTWLTGMKCSKCGKLFDLRVGYNYCPSCGTRMKGGAE